MVKKEHFDAARILYEFGTLRRLPRMHQQALLTSDPTDNIASHTARTAFIGMLIALHEGLDVGKVVTMCLIHDLHETRAGDHNWIAKLYVKTNAAEVVADQFAPEVFEPLREIMKEYERRATAEATAAKDADLIDELLLLKEIAHAGNLEARHWLSSDGGKNRRAERMQALTHTFSKELMEAAYDMSPTDWWKNFYTSRNR